MPLKQRVNLYLLLNASPDATEKEIKKAYLKLVQTYHPDKNRGNKLAEKKFQQINEAWQILKDPVKRKQFDESLKKVWNSPPSSDKPPVKPALQKEKPLDLEIPLRVSMEDLCQSRLKTIHYFKPVQGQKIKSSLVIQIPSGVKQGVSLRFKGEGGAEGKKAFGDLYVKIQIKAHRLFQRTEGSEDIVLICPVSFVTAVQGGKLEIPSPYGFLALNLKPPVRDKQLLKVRGHGLPKNSKGERGDLFVQIFIDYPLKDKLNIQNQMEKLSFEQKKAYVEKFKNISLIYPEVLKFQKKVQELKKLDG